MATYSASTKTSSFDINNNLEIPTHFLYPATIFADRNPHIISTILGSCVAVCMWDPYQKIGGMNHYLLPLWNGQGLPSPKYGSIAIEKLLEKMLAHGCKKANIKSKIFGGGEVIETKVNHFNIGKRNIEIAQSTLSDLQIPIVSENVGGKLGRKLLMNSGTGEIKMKFIEKNIMLNK